MLLLQVKDGDLPLIPPRRGQNLYMVPQGIRPVVQLTAIEVNHNHSMRQDQTNPIMCLAFPHLQLLSFLYLISNYSCNVIIIVFVTL